MERGAMLVDHTQRTAPHSGAFRFPLPSRCSATSSRASPTRSRSAAMGTVALAGATAANTMFLALAFAIFGFLSGTSIVAAQRIGAQDMDGFARTVRAGLTVPLVAGVLFFVASMFGAAWRCTPRSANSPAARRAQRTSCCVAFRSCRCNLRLADRGAGRGRQPSNRRVVLLIVNLVHIPLLLMLALGWLTHHPMGIVGAGAPRFFPRRLRRSSR